METTFHKILEEKMGKEERVSCERTTPAVKTSQEFYIAVESITAAKAPRSFSGSLYIEYRKDPKALEELRLQREKQAFCAFLNKMPSEKAKSAAQNFYRYGVRKFLNGSLSDLKKDFRFIAKQVHPDVHTLDTDEKKVYFHREFRLLRESFEILMSAFPLAK